MWYDENINNGFAKTVNNIQITHRIANGFRNIDYFIIIIYLYNGKLEIFFN